MEHSSKISEYILTCHCQDMPKYAVEAFASLFPGQQHPILLAGGRQILDEANRFANSPFGEFLKGVSKNKEKFAYYVKSNGKKIECWDLKKGIKIP